MEKLSVSVLNQKNPVQIIKQLVAKDIKQVHYDIMGKSFVKNKAFTVRDVQQIVKSSPEHTVDVHLMVKNPEYYLKRLKTTANYFTVHFEAVSRLRMLKILEKHARHKIGIALKPQTPWSEVVEFLPYISHVLIMSVEPGKGGQKFLKGTYAKIQELKRFLRDNKWKTIVEVDGGINNLTGPRCVKNGASSLVSGTYLVENMNAPNIKRKITS